MNDTRGGDSERIAPIIPLFGKKSADQTNVRPMKPSAADTDSTEKVDSRRGGGGGLWRSTGDGPTEPTPIGDERDAGTPSERHPARGAAAKASASDGPVAPKLRALRDPRGDSGSGDDSEPVRSPDEIRATGEEALLRKLRSKSLSISEARLVLRGHGLDAGQIDDVIDDFRRRQYLDDAVLAGLLVTSGVERKGQGRVALSRALSQRGLPRDVIDAALDELPDDDSERALEFARSKARSMARLDNDTALRRLVGQLSRRGYNGAVAMNAAKTALREASSGGSSSGVRFVDSD
jgi:regulatory protein